MLPDVSAEKRGEKQDERVGLGTEENKRTGGQIPTNRSHRKKREGRRMKLGSGADSPIGCGGRSVPLGVTVIYTGDHLLLVGVTPVTQQRVPKSQCCDICCPNPDPPVPRTRQGSADKSSSVPLCN